MNNERLPEDLQFQMLWERAVLLQVLYQLARHMEQLSADDASLALFPAILNTSCPNVNWVLLTWSKLELWHWFLWPRGTVFFCLAASGLWVGVLVLSCPANTASVAAGTKKAMQNCSHALSKQVKLWTSACRSLLLAGSGGPGVSGHISSYNWRYSPRLVVRYANLALSLGLFQRGVIDKVNHQLLEGCYSPSLSAGAAPFFCLSSGFSFCSPLEFHSISLFLSLYSYLEDTFANKRQVSVNYFIVYFTDFIFIYSSLLWFFYLLSTHKLSSGIWFHADSLLD